MAAGASSVSGFSSGTASAATLACRTQRDSQRSDGAGSHRVIKLAEACVRSPSRTRSDDRPDSGQGRVRVPSDRVSVTGHVKTLAPARSVRTFCHQQSAAPSASVSGSTVASWLPAYFRSQKPSGRRRQTDTGAVTVAGAGAARDRAINNASSSANRAGRSCSGGPSQPDSRGQIVAARQSQADSRTPDAARQPRPDSRSQTAAARQSQQDSCSQTVAVRQLQQDSRTPSASAISRPSRQSACRERSCVVPSTGDAYQQLRTV